MTENKPQLQPTIFAIFGLTGDLAQRKLLPALYNLVENDLLHKDTIILGISRRSVTVDEVLDGIDKNIHASGGECKPETLAKLRKKIKMHQMDLTSAEDFDKLKQKLSGIEDKVGEHMNRLFYLSIPPQMFIPIVRLLGERGLNSGCEHESSVTRLLVEKPFGYDLKSAKELIERTSDYFKEDQIFRIDHYVAKESVQNILTFRFNNPLFSDVWDNEHISHIQITAKEKLDIEGRAIFYEETGALRDVIQSHLIQLFAILTMERPPELTANEVHKSAVALLKSAPAISSQSVWNDSARGQYAGYTDEVNNPRSHVETYAAIKLEVNNERWRGVPILIRTGKALDKKLTEACVVFKPHHKGDKPNVLRFGIQPENIELDIQAKKPSFEYETQNVDMLFDYGKVFNDKSSRNPYERVLVDAVRGDRTLFATSEVVIESWRIIENIIQEWAKSNDKLETYKKGSAGSKSSDKLADHTGLGWLN